MAPRSCILMPYAYKYKQTKSEPIKLQNGGTFMIMAIQEKMTKKEIYNHDNFDIL